MADNKRLGKYELLEELGKGGFGTVYRAQDLVLKRDVALKVLHAQLMVDPEAIGRFEKEAQRVASIEHASIVPIYDYGEDAGRLFIAMRYMPGGSLKAHLGQGALPFERALTILKQVGAGLAYAHEQGLIHRDIKPQNILFDRQGIACISDLGLAKSLNSMSSDSDVLRRQVGTPEYMCPEAWDGEGDTVAADQYSLACVFTEMLTGKVLFDAKTPTQVMKQHAMLGPVFPAQWAAGVPAGLQAVLTKALAKEAGERYASVEEFVAGVTGLKGPVAQTHPTPSANPAKKTGKTEKTESISATPQDDQLAAPLPAAPPLSRKKLLILFAAGLAVLILALFGGKIWVALFPKGEPGHGYSYVVAPDGTEMSYVPAGTFEMGSNDGNSEEQPVHRVRLEAFWIDRTEVTNGMYAKCVAAGACDAPAEVSSFTYNYYYGKSQYTDYPVIYVSWFGARAYCAWAGVELPTEAQWEYAARGDAGRVYPWWENSAPNANLLNYNGNIGDTTAVGSYPEGASWVGALDMAGNVWEWVADRYGPYTSGTVSNPSGPTSGDYRVLRGGSWYGDEYSVRSAYRNRNSPNLTNYYIGFRCSSSQQP